MPLQLPFSGPFEEWLEIMTRILNVAYALSIRGYFLLIIIGLTIYATGLNDAFSKFLVVGGVVISIIGPPIVLYFGSIVGVEGITVESADIAWYSFLSLSDIEMLRMFLALCSLIVSLCLLIGSILYFTPSNPDLKTRGQSLIVRAIICVSVFAFIQLVVSW